MQFLDLTLASPPENLALDEALLEHAERAGRPSEVLRVWESPLPMVVLGRSSRAEEEAHLKTCQTAGIPVLRRVSGGAAIVASPGCLMYAVVLSYQLRPELRPIDSAHRFVLETIASRLRRDHPGVERKGISDLAIDDRKFSGNSMRARRDHFLYHGTLLYDFPLSLVSQCLAMPQRQPKYRSARSHADFLTNLPATSLALKQSLREAWSAEPTSQWPRELTQELVAQRYSQSPWNLAGSR